MRSASFKARGSSFFVVLFLDAIIIASPARAFCFGRQVARGTEATRLEEGKPAVVFVSGRVPWTDAEIEVLAGEELFFSAEGKISLQKGNPEAECGPEGCDLQTARQPLPDKNLGALIGKVLVTVIETFDDKTKEEKRDEVAFVFFIGQEGRVEMPARGRLFLGINDNVIGDNDGEFKVLIKLAGQKNVPGLWSTQY